MNTFSLAFFFNGVVVWQDVFVYISSMICVLNTLIGFSDVRQGFTVSVSLWFQFGSARLKATANNIYEYFEIVFHELESPARAGFFKVH